MGAGGNVGGSPPEHVRRIYLSYGYPHAQLKGPYRLEGSLSQKDKKTIKRSYLNREFIVSSTTVTIQRFKYRHSDQLLIVPFNSNLIDRIEESNTPILQCNAIKFDKIFHSARLEKAETSIPWYLSPTNSVFYGIFIVVFSLMAIFNCLNNIQTISFWSDNTNSNGAWFIFVNVIYSFGFCLYFTVKRPYNICIWSVICCLCLLFGPLICIMCLMHILMYEEVNKIICNDNLHQMENDIAYFILTADWISNNDKQSNHNWNILKNISCHILNIIMDDFIVTNLTNNKNNDFKYRKYNQSQMIKFETEYQINSECLFDYYQCDKMVKETKNFNKDIEENTDKYFKCLIKVFMIVSILCFICNYYVVIALLLFDDATFNEWSIFTFDFVLYCRIISDLLILIFCIPYFWYRKYQISQQFIKSGGVHWLDPISFEYFCDNNLDKQYGMECVCNFVFDYCYFIDIYMNNYIMYQTLLALQKMEELKGDWFLNLLSDDVLNILVNYLWFQQSNFKESKMKNRKYYLEKELTDYKELRAMVKNKQSEILKRLNQLTTINNYNSSRSIVELSDNEFNESYQPSQNKKQTYDVLPQTIEDDQKYQI